MRSAHFGKVVRSSEISDQSAPGIRFRQNRRNFCKIFNSGSGDTVVSDWLSVVPTQGEALRGQFRDSLFETVSLFCQDYSNRCVFSDPKLVQNRFLPRPLRLLRMLVPACPNLLSRNLLLPVRQQLTLLLLYVFYVFSMGGLTRALMGLFWTGLNLNRTHSRYLLDPRLHATVAKRLTMTKN